MKVLNGRITAADIEGRRAVVWHGYDGRTCHANIVGGRARERVRILYKAAEGAEQASFGMATATVFKGDADGLRRIELA